MKPFLMTERDRVRDVAELWRKTYQRNGAFPKQDDRYIDKGAAYASLLGLDLETCSAADVEAIIGNRSWTSLRCDACAADVAAVIIVGQAPDLESNSVSRCVACLREAAALVEPSAEDER